MSAPHQPRLSRRAHQYLNDHFDQLDARYDAFSHLTIGALQDAHRLVYQLNRPTIFGRTRASLTTELNYRRRSFFTPSQLIMIRHNIASGPFEFFGNESIREFTGDHEDMLQLSLTSLDEKAVLLCAVSTYSRSTGEFDQFTTKTWLSEHHLALNPLIPLYIRRKSLRSELPLGRYGYVEPGTTPNLTIRRLPQCSDFIAQAYTSYRETITELWGSLERIWCELLLRQRPHVRPLSLLSIEARIRSFTGNTIRVAHTDGTTIGRCPDIKDVLTSGTLLLRTATGDVTIDAHSVLEIVPWKARFGDSLVTIAS